MRRTTGLLGLVALLAWVFLARPYDNWPPIRSDGVGYHVWVNGLIAGDLSFCPYRRLLDTAGAISVLDEQRGVCGNKYPPGVALLQLPVVAPWANPHLHDGFPREVHALVLALGSGLLLATVFFSYLTLRRLGLPPMSAQAVVGLFVFGTGLFHYATYDASFSHIYSACGIALLLWLLTRSRDTGWHAWMVVLFALVTFWLYTVRQTNGWPTLLIASMAALTATRRSASLIGLTWLGATGAALLLHAAYNQYVTQTVTVFSYGDERFASLGGHVGDVWFSYERGLGTYYPIMIGALILGAFSRERLLAGAFVLAVAVFSLLYGSWHSWMLGQGMGHRGFVELAPFGIAVFGSALQSLPGRWRGAALAGAGACVYVTLQIMVGYWTGTYPAAGAGSRVYWQHLLQPTPTQREVTALALIAAALWILVGNPRRRHRERPDRFAADRSRGLTGRFLQ